MTADPSCPSRTAQSRLLSPRLRRARPPRSAPRPSAPGRPHRSRTAACNSGCTATSVFLFVLISAVAGVLLVILPWTPEWTDNYLLLSFPWLRTFVSTGFFRGLCSGLGLLDIWIGFWEALHYHEHQ